MICDSEMLILSEDQEAELSKLLGDFIAKNYSIEISRNLETRLQFVFKDSSIMEERSLGLTWGCLPGQPQDLIRCNPGERYGRKSRSISITKDLS